MTDHLDDIIGRSDGINAFNKGMPYRKPASVTAETPSETSPTPAEAAPVSSDAAPQSTPSGSTDSASTPNQSGSGE